MQNTNVFVQNGKNQSNVLAILSKSSGHSEMHIFCND